MKGIVSIVLTSILFVISGAKAYSASPIDSTISKQQTTDQCLDPSDPIVTDRPDQTESPFLVPKRRIQIESGYWIMTDKQEALTTQQIAYNSSLLKVGISSQLELRLIAEYLGNYIVHQPSRTLLSRSIGFNSVAIGTKLFISEQKGLIPKTSLIAHLLLPYIGYHKFRPAHLTPKFRFVMHHSLPHRISLSYNIGAEWDGNSQNATAIYTISLSMNPIPRTGIFIEAYGFLTENSNENNRFNGTFTNDHRMDAGVTFAASHNLQLDVSAGIGFSKQSPDKLLSFGISFRLPN